ncbi:hypothetical protein LCGC14_1005970 [marine sediment metagenome]|uniref:Uncharacterized protein n=1 Tax=marine sediment metagenome TaxID=412755 RepID=A0A0F9N1S0_9ZZZZ
MPEEIVLNAQITSAKDLMAQSSTASILLANGMNAEALRTNAALRKDEWESFDEALIEEVTQRMVGVDDLMSRGLVHNIPNGMGSTTIEWETVDETREAEVNMDGIARAQSDRLDFQTYSLPLPIIHRDFYINSRVLAASRTRGESLDTTNMRIAARKVSEKVEQILFNGISYEFAGGNIYGYTTHPQRNTVSLGTSWTASGVDGDDILEQVLSMINAAHGDRMFGPYIMYVPTAYWVKLLEDFKTNSDKSIMTRIMEIPTLTDIKVADFLTADNVLLIQMTQDVVDMVVGMQPSTVQWDTQGGFLLNFKVLTIMIPRIKRTDAGRSGIVHLS